MKKNMKIIFKIIGNAVFVLLLLIAILMLVYVVRVKVFVNSDKLGEVKTNFYTILSPSMYPTIKPGDVIITLKNDNNKYGVGDIITFISSSENSKGVTITHRVQSILIVDGENQYTTKGDNNPSADSTSVLEKDILGRVIFKIPKIGYVQQFLVTKTGWIAVILLPCLGIVIYDILKMLRLAGKKSILNKDNSIVNAESNNSLINAESLVNNELETNESGNINFDTSNDNLKDDLKTDISNSDDEIEELLDSDELEGENKNENI